MRDRDSILRRMVALRVPRGVEDDLAMDAQWFEDLRASATAVEPPRVGADDGPAHGSPRAMQVVKAIIKCSGEMQNDLCGKRLVGNLLKRCDTPLIRKPGFSTTDVCRLRGTSVPWCPRADECVYLSIPHPAGDPVVVANKERVLEFLRTTTFDNARHGVLAATCLTLRGVSNVRALITMGPSGVGQSLNTCLVANLFGGSHGFMDMNVFYSEDELRMQADTFTGMVNLWGVTYSPPRT